MARACRWLIVAMGEVMRVFDLFKTEPIVLLKIERGRVRGDVITNSYKCDAIVKRRESLADGQAEDITAASSVHIKPMDFSFIKENGGVGNGVEIDGVRYEITAVSHGVNFDSGETEHITLKLERSGAVWIMES